MAGSRFLFFPAILNDPDAIAAGAQALLDKGQRVTALHAHLWRCAPNEAGFRRAAVVYARPGQPAPAGWQLGVQWGVLQLLYSTDPDTPPPAVPYAAQNDALLRVCGDSLRGLPVALAAAVLLLGIQLVAFRRDLVMQLSDGYAVGAFLLLAWLVVYLAATLLAARVRLGQLRQARTRDEPPPPPQRTAPGVEAAAWLLLLASLAIMAAARPFTAVLLAVLLAACAVLLLWQARLRARGRSVFAARVVTALVLLAISVAAGLLWAFAVSAGIAAPPGQSLPAGRYTQGEESWPVYDDPLPLTIEALTGEEAVWTKQRITQASPLLRYTRYSQYALDDLPREADWLTYTVADTALPPVQQAVVETLLAEHQDEVQPDGTVFLDSYHPVDPAPWGAQAVYQLHWSQGILDDYLVVWPGRVVTLTFYWTPTDAQLRQAAQALRPQ